MDDKMSSTEIKNKARRVGNARYLAHIKEMRAKSEEERKQKEMEAEAKRIEEAEAKRLKEEEEAKAKRLKEEEEAKAKKLKEEEEARRILEDKCNEERVKGWVKSNNFKGKLCKLWQITCVYSISSPPCLLYTQHHPNHQTKRRNLNRMSKNEVRVLTTNNKRMINQIIYYIIRQYHIHL